MGQILHIFVFITNWNCCFVLLRILPLTQFLDFEESNNCCEKSKEIDTGVVLDNVFYVTDEVKTSMIVDGGCPSTLYGKDILDRYLSRRKCRFPA